MTDFAVSTITLRSNEPSAPTKTKVLKASQQVVSGMLYHLDIELRYTDCPQDRESCKRVQTCSVSIWDQPWLNKREVTKLDCKDASNNKDETDKTVTKSAGRRNLGGLVPADPSSKYIQSFASFALQAVQARSNVKNALDIIQIRRAATQTVAGKKIYLTLEIGQTTDCGKTKCPVDEQADRQICKVEIWTRPWLNEQQVTDLKCIPVTKKQRLRRSSSSSSDDDDGHKRHHGHKHRSKSLKKVQRLKHMRAFRNYMIQFDKVYTTWDEFERRYKIYRYFT